MYLDVFASLAKKQINLAAGWTGQPGLSIPGLIYSWDEHAEEVWMMDEKRHQSPKLPWLTMFITQIRK